MTSILASLLVLVLAQVAGGQPAISFPFNSQLPPAARVNKFFSYSLPPSTFTSDSKKITYSLGEHPGWLAIESDGRRLYGTPTDADLPPGQVVGQTVQVIATDDKGPTTMEATLVVSRNPPPAVQIPMSKQIDSFGKFSAPSSVLFYPSTGFEFSFDRKTFGEQQFNYYATSGDGSPLPAWVSFDAPSLTFSGKTPPFKSLIQPPQAFDFRLVASDIVGFAASSLSFSIVVGSHKLTTDNPIISLNASWGSELVYKGLENGIQLDGKPVAPGDLDATTDRLPKWLSYDSRTARLQGSPGPGDHTTNFTISYHDPFADTLDVLVIVHVASSLFESTLDDMEARPGSYFEFDLSKHFRNPGDIDLKVTTSPQEDWLKVDGFKLSGQVPKTAKGDFKITIRAKSKKSGLEETEVFGISFLSLDGSTASPTAATPTSTATQTPTGSHDPTAEAAESESGHLSTGEILLATIIPIIFITILLMLLVCYLRRRRARRTYLSNKFRTKISHPMIASPGTNDSDSTMHEVPRAGAAAHTKAKHFGPGPVGYAEVLSQSSRRRSSQTLGGSSVADRPRPLLEDARTVTIRSVGSSDSDSERQSWVTVEGDDAGMAARNQDVARNHRSDTTSFADSTHQVLPTPDFFSEARNGPFRSGLDTAIPTMEDLPSVQPSPVHVYRPQHGHYRPRQSLGAQSNTTSSSTALPPIFAGGFRSHTRNDASVSNWETIAESEAGDSIAELRRPDRALISSRPDESRQWYDTDSSNGSKSLGTDPSFGSSENWRVIGPRGGPSTVYRDMVDEAPFHPSRPGTRQGIGGDGGGGAARHESPEPMSPSKWADDVDTTTMSHLRPSASATSVRSRDDEQVKMSGARNGGGKTATTPAWIRDRSGQPTSDGSGSFKVFL
ncbi:hypothetical protein CDD83_8454 [Cordyceps sp. RAO-2017]|nr:hypothetical protein CDD83_8454 [Cordyceps sp. RAO-2017]